MLKVTDLSISIDQKPIVQGFNLVCEPGTIHAIMGPNGSGKSTMAYALMGHPGYTITAGDITFNGQSLVGLSPDKRAKIGVFLAFQHPMEIPGVRVITFLKEAYYAITGIQPSMEDFNTAVAQALHLLNLDPAFAYRNLNEGFSGGEKKRLEMLQMLILKPTLVILDEIDSGLDIDGLAVVAKALQKARANNPTMTTLVITHYQRLLTYVQPDYVHIMNNGTLIKTGNADLAGRVEQKGYDGAIAN